MDSRSRLFSVRMRASAGAPHEAGGRHVSGAERLVREEELEAAIVELLRRARDRQAPPEHVRISVDEVPPEQVHRTPALPVRTYSAADPESARGEAAAILAGAGVSPHAIEAAFRLLLHGVKEGGLPMRGAALLDAATGDRLDPDANRGVRASRFDYAPEVREAVRAALQAAGLGHFRTYEALAVATKVIWAGALAELCWSDDPEYVAGYVATPREGYARFPRFKPAGATGGRVFFVEESASVSGLVARLQQECLLIDTPSHVS